LKTISAPLPKRSGSLFTSRDSQTFSRQTATRTFITSKIIKESQKEDENGPDFITVNWILKDGAIQSVRGKIGVNLLELAHKKDIDLEGACEGSLACSTCHVILEPPVYDTLPEPSDEENDMLDLAFGLTATSRLGCQVKLSKELDGVKVKLPSATRNMAVDGYVPKHH
jgi:ferredoxin